MLGYGSRIERIDGIYITAGTIDHFETKELYEFNQNDPNHPETSPMSR